jgi:hypothetical protein
MHRGGKTGKSWETLKSVRSDPPAGREISARPFACLKAPAPTGYTTDPGALNNDLGGGILPDRLRLSAWCAGGFAREALREPPKGRSKYRSL